MEPGIKLILSGPGLEQRTPPEFQALIKILGEKSINVRVVRTREALEAEREAERAALRPKFDPEKKDLLGHVGFDEFIQLLEEEGLSPKTASSVWNSLAEYSRPHRIYEIDYDDLPAWFTPIVVDSRYDGDFKSWRENARESQHIYELKAQRIRREGRQAETWVNMQALAVAIEDGYLGRKLNRYQDGVRIGLKSRQALVGLTQKHLAGIPTELTQE